MGCVCQSVALIVKRLIDSETVISIAIGWIVIRLAIGWIVIRIAIGWMPQINRCVTY